MSNNLPERISGKPVSNWAEPERVDWDETWMAVAVAIARRSGCIRRQAGCVIVSRDNRVVATGYNGPPATMQVNRTATAFKVGDAGIGFKSKTVATDATCAKDCPRSQTGAENATNNYDNCISLHSEENALLYAERRDVESGSIYVSGGLPCWHCAKLIAGSGLKRVIATVSERDSDRQWLVRRLWDWCGVGFYQWES